jgi:hypothetical protein
VGSWPECESGLYDPRCCRFPKSCSCTSYDPEHVKEAQLESCEHPFREKTPEGWLRCTTCGDVDDGEE